MKPFDLAKYQASVPHVRNMNIGTFSFQLKIKKKKTNANLNDIHEDRFGI